jgi:hypothetical protein
MNHDIYQEGNLAYALGNILFKERLPIDIGTIKAGTQFNEEECLLLARNPEWVNDLDPSPIQRKLSDATYKWILESEDNLDWIEGMEDPED